MSEFKQYRRKQIAELRPVDQTDINDFNLVEGKLYFVKRGMNPQMDGSHIGQISISKEDLINGSPKIGDMIARNPKNHNDQWLVAKEYFEDNFEPLDD